MSIGITPAFGVGGGPFDVRCDFCDQPIYGKPVDYDNFQICCECFEEEPRCEYCDGDGPLRTYEWDIPATWDEPGDNGTAVVCSACEASFSKRRTA